MPKASKPLTLLISAGEPSGDRLGAALMAALKAKLPGVQFVGVGGSAMEAQGLTSLFPMADLSVMGLAEVLPSIPRILRRLAELVALAESTNPAAVITIDNQEFSYRLAKRLRATHPTLPIVLYTAPKIWAWRPGRLKKLRGVFSHILVKFPFEMPFFKTGGIPATYVGHPALTMLAGQPRNSLNSAFTLALLPGSRKSEFKRHWPLMLQTYRALRHAHPQLTGLLALADDAAIATCRALAPWSAEDNITLTTQESRFAALANCRAALAKSGTNNLELALLGLPAVVCYRMNALTYWLAKRLVRVKYISLPNLILNTPVYPEFIQGTATAPALAQALTPLLLQKGAFAEQKKRLARLAASMETPRPPAEMAAEVVQQLLLEKKP